MKEQFLFPTKYDFNISAAPEVQEVTYGDGYAQRAPKGLNHNLREYSLTFAGRREDVDDCEKFLARMGGYKSFLWYSPLDYKEILVVCKSWDRTGEGINSSLTFTFKQVVN